MKARITIPEPCHADWNSMQPNEKGRHCELCALTVIDFTGWELLDIANYLQANAGQKVCGRFRSTQIDQSFDLKTFAPNVIRWHTHAFRKVAALIVICFAIASSGCNMGAASKPADELSGDTVMVQPVDTSASATLCAPQMPGPSSSTVRPSSNGKKKAKKVREAVTEPTGYEVQGGALMEVIPEPMYMPARKDTVKFQPPIGPPEDSWK